jgi:tetratricopeptide (TPR) repeat protein
VTDTTVAKGASHELKQKLRAGVRSEDFAALGALLGVAEAAGERSLARTLVRESVALQADGLRLARGDAETTSARPDDSRVVDGRSSFLMRLTRGGDQASVDLERIEDLRTLVAVVRAGNLRQRRAATQRIGELLINVKRVPSDQARKAIDTLLELRALPISYELWLFCSRLPGADGRRARAAGEQWDELSRGFEQAVRSFWDGADPGEPTLALRDEQRVQLLVRARDLSDEAVRHLCAVIEGCAGDSERRGRAALLGALLNAGDVRLLPALRSLIESGEGDLLIPAARALGRIDDPRAHSALKAAFERTVTAEARLVLAGALGSAGDSRGSSYVREVIKTGDERLLLYALEALGELGGRDDVQAVTELLGRREPQLVMAAVQTLGRIADGRALLPLHELAQNAKSAALRAEIEDALEAMKARMELLGEEAPPLARAAHSFDTAKHAALVKRKDPAVVRVRARFYQIMGQLWLALGARARGIARLEAAAALLPDSPSPVLSVALSYARSSDSAQALAGFRRVLGIDRNAVENNPGAVRMLAQAFLRRAEAMEHEGRDDIARGLLEEALSIDLRKAPSDLRFALEQRLQALQSRAA